MSEDFISPDNELALRKVEEMFLDNIETVFQTGINPETTLRFGTILPFSPKLIKEKFAEGLVVVKISHKKAASGDEFILLATRTAALISDLMVMGDGSAEFNSDEHLDAVQEIIDQIYGAFSASQSDSLKADLNYNLSSAKVETEELLKVAKKSWAAIGFDLELQGEHQIFHLLSPEALDNFIGGISGEAGDEATSEPAATEANGTGAKSTAPQSAQFQSFAEAEVAHKHSSEIEMLMDLKLPITIELGRTSMFIKDILNLSPGAIVELDKLSGDPVDIYVNEKKFAEGEVVVIDENFGVRITELVKAEDRVRKLS